MTTVITAGIQAFVCHQSMGCAASARPGPVASTPAGRKDENESEFGRKYDVDPVELRQGYTASMSWTVVKATGKPGSGEMLGQSVAVKRIPMGADIHPADLASLREEVTVLRGLDHAHIVKL